jgi:hypothetical protein
MTHQSPSEDMKSVDGVVYRSFVEKFNEAYASTLPEEQKVLLGKYVSSFVDNGVDFKLYMNDEIGRLKTKVKEALENDDIISDTEMKKSTNEVYNLLEGANRKPIDEELVGQVLNIQNFIREVES